MTSNNSTKDDPPMTEHFYKDDAADYSGVGMDAEFSDVAGWDETPRTNDAVAAANNDHNHSEKVYNGQDAETDKFSSDDEILPQQQQQPATAAAAAQMSSGASQASFFRHSLRRFSSATHHQPYDHRNSLIRSITATAAATMERQYSVAELVQTLNHQNHHSHNHSNSNNNNNGSTSSPELERRVLDFQLAQRKRFEKYGTRSTFGIFGMYNHLANVRIDLEWSEDAAYRRLHNEPYLAWTDFDDARIKTLSRPYFTYIIVLLCSIMLVVEFGVNDWKIEPLNVNPMIGPSKDTLITLGARDTERIVNDNEWYRIVTPMVLHAGIIHYIVNMAAVWFIGIAIEQNHGWVKSLILFMIPGVGGTLLSAIFLPQYISVGASGGIFGLVGGCIADLILHWNLLFIQVLDETPKQVYRRNFYAVSILLLEIFFNIALGLITPFIDNFSHLGGMIYGVCCAFTAIEAFSVSGFFGGIRTTTFDKLRTFTIKFCGLIISIALIMVTTVWLATTSDATQSPCSGCRYISCVPFPFFSDDKWWYCDDCDFVTATLSNDGIYYVQIELTCPNDSLELVDISNDLLTNGDDVSKRLPTYCRDHCDDVFN